MASRPLSERARRRWQLTTLASVALVAGGVLRGYLPPFVLDDPFWRQFWSGPPVAGLFAVAAAAVAFYPALRSTRIARENAAREQWWNRAEWALGLASSSNRDDRQVANDALAALLADATQTEAKMIVRSIEILQRGQDVDSAAKATHDRGWRRIFCAKSD
ncbi:hypothetical protein GW571_15075 (plasmid) [Clavibacter capsici]|uniref:Uncharacterized protein n=1 Tax=Clavibacter capsici TaxID=1874630 RepID=A0AAE7CD73_9MICO|nr:hypothetical protein [Clavibacter capsici]QIS40519.1 hypothetical protein GW572_15150 [Clavibacter capsici]QIS43551.1 hypothetical protein GW571_15075 [Clavibacter capsici]QIS46512.1 hypothetical protein GW570_15155 [Clavibacter capsici]